MMKMFTVKKRTLLLTLLLLCLVYIGYTGMGTKSRTPVAVIKTEGVQGASITPIQEEKSPAGEEPAVSEEENSPDDYFVNYRIEREKIRSQQVEILQEIVNNPNSVTDARKDAQEKLLALTQTLENELKLENLIRAKNYQDAVVLIQPESVMVVLKTDSISDEDTTRIADLVANTTGHGYDDVIVTTKN